MVEEGKVIFIAEDDSEKIILNRTEFEQFLQKVKQLKNSDDEKHELLIEFANDFNEIKKILILLDETAGLSLMMNGKGSVAKGITGLMRTSAAVMKDPDKYQDAGKQVRELMDKYTNKNFILNNYKHGNRALSNGEQPGGQPEDRLSESSKYTEQRKQNKLRNIFERFRRFINSKIGNWRRAGS